MDRRARVEDGGDAQGLGRRMGELVSGYQVSAAIGVVARLGVADHLSGAPAQAGELASRVGADPRSLGRVLRLLAEVGVVERLGDGRFALTALGGMLRSDVPGSVRRAAIVASEEWHWRAYGHLIDSVRSGKPGFRDAHGCGFWEYLGRHPEAAALVDDSLARAAAFTAAAFVRTYDLSGIGRLVDVGAGRGILMRQALEAHPHLRGVVFDLPGVIEGARASLADAGLADRCEAIAGDFFEGVPSGGDAYVLSWILHDWDDDSASRILAGCRRAIGRAGRLLAIELLVPSEDEPRPSPEVERLLETTDIEMLAVVGGRERTRAEYGSLFAAAGFELTRVVPLEPLPWSVLEGKPV